MTTEKKGPKSPKKTKYHPPKSACLVSRQSGLRLDVNGATSLGKKPRFGGETVVNPHSPWGDSYFKNNALFKRKLEEGKKCTMGVGGRCAYIKGTPDVGPATYTPVTSVAKYRSPLDGKQYCNATMKSRHEVVIGAPAPSEQAIKPGPGTYDVRENFYYHREYPMGSGKMIFKGSGPKYSTKETKSIKGKNKVCPEFRDTSVSLLKKLFMDEKGNQALKSTFGVAERWESEERNSSQTANGPLYYSHVKLTEDYTKTAKAMSLGSGERTQWHKASQHTASPASYEPNFSAAKMSSPMDYNGAALRMLSPITQYSMLDQRKKNHKRAKSQPAV